MKGLFPVTDLHELSQEVSLAHSLELDFYGARMSVAATTPRPLGTLRQVTRYFELERAESRETDESSARMLLIEDGTREHELLNRCLGRTNAGELGRGHLLLADWFPWAIRLEGHGLMHYYASKLLRLWVVERLDAEIMTLHAASLCSPDGVGVLLVGEAAAGKTTLTIRLIDRGFRYCADDTSCIRRKDLACLPFPMALVVRADLQTGEPAHQELCGHPPDLELLDEPRWLFERPDAVSTACVLQWLIFISRDRDWAKGGFRPLSASEAALLLLRNTVLSLGADPNDCAATQRNFATACQLADTTASLAADSSQLDLTVEGIIDKCSRGVQGVGEPHHE